MDDDAILFFVEPEVASESTVPDGARDGRDVGGTFGEPRRQLVQRLRDRVTVPVDQLQRQVQQLVGMVTHVFDQAERQVAQQPERRLSLEEIELTVEVNAEGQLGILGNGGKGGGKGGIKLTFKRK